MGLLKHGLQKTVGLVLDKNFREFVKLYVKYGGRPRKTLCTNVHFKSFIIGVPDAPSFIWQYKELFVDETYRFTTVSTSPIIYDCGANIGMSVLYFKYLFPHAVIKAFEADRQIYSLLESNVKRNRFSNDITLFNQAVWIHDEGVDFVGDGADGGAIALAGGAPSEDKTPSIRLRDLLAREARVDMLKLDIEGAEVDVMRDSESCLDRVENLFIEYHGWKSAPQQLSELLAILERQGFRYDIQSITRLIRPFLVASREKATDLQLNIYCHR